MWSFRYNLMWIVLFLCSVVNAQSNDSWINIQLQTDNYPEETSWSIYNISGGAIAASDSALAELTLYDTVIDVLSGDYIISLEDSWGDGLGASQWGGTDGSFLIQNDCQDTLFYAEGDFGLQLVDTLTIAPCAPPISGCIDELATNFLTLINNRLTLILSNAVGFFCNVFCPNTVTPCPGNVAIGLT